MLNLVIKKGRQYMNANMNVQQMNYRAMKAVAAGVEACSNINLLAVIENALKSINEDAYLKNNLVDSDRKFLEAQVVFYAGQVSR